MTSVPASTPYKILRIYLKGASVEVPHMAELPKQAISPEVGLDMQTLAEPAWPGAMECVLRISLHARLAGRNVFLIEVSVAGIFELELPDMAEAHRFVRQVAPAILFPFARKDLANMAVSAGFQPVLLDHVDFDSMLNQVIQSQQVARSSPAPMRVDVIAAKPLAAPTPVAAADDDTDDVWQATVPLPVTEAAPEPALPLPPPAGGIGKAGAAWLLVGTLGLALGGWSLFRFLQPMRMGTPQEASVTPVVATPAPVVAAPVVVIPEATQAAITTSQARLSEQASSGFTLEVGSLPVTAPLEVLSSLPSDRPLFVLPAPGGRLRVFYGVFASRADAEATGATVQQPGAKLDQPMLTAVMIGDL